VFALSASRTFHWYSGTPLTVIDDRVADALCAVQDSPGPPQRTQPLVMVRSVAQLTVMPVPMASVRYG
jgi:hypothetical protein